MFTSIAAFLGLEIKDRLSRLVTVIGVALVALIFLIVAGVYLMGWVRTKLLAFYDVATVDLILFAVFLFFGLALALTAYLMSRAKPQRSATAAALAAAPLARVAHDPSRSTAATHAGQSIARGSGAIRHVADHSPHRARVSPPPR